MSTQTTLELNDKQIIGFPSAIQMDGIHYISIGNKDSFTTAILKYIHDNPIRIRGSDPAVVSPVASTRTKEDTENLIKNYGMKLLKKAAVKDSFIKTGVDSVLSSIELNNGYTMTTMSKVTVNTKSERNYWLKVIFSGIFTLAGLYIVLSGNKFDAETKKWAFSVLALVTGVWIGSV